MTKASFTVSSPVQKAWFHFDQKCLCIVFKEMQTPVDFPRFRLGWVGFFFFFSPQALSHFFVPTKWAVRAEWEGHPCQGSQVEGGVGNFPESMKPQLKPKSKWIWQPWAGKSLCPAQSNRSVTVSRHPGSGIVCWVESGRTHLWLPHCHLLVGWPFCTLAKMDSSNKRSVIPS